jgi:hypothetical protein
MFYIHPAVLSELHLRYIKGLKGPYCMAGSDFEIGEVLMYD